MSQEQAYRDAVVRADAARARLRDSAEAAKARIAPARLKQDAKDKIKGAALDVVAKGAAQARERPYAIGGAVIAFGLYLARRPLLNLFQRLYVRFTETYPEHSETDDG